jgi:hypothetical protein
VQFLAGRWQDVLFHLGLQIVHLCGVQWITVGLQNCAVLFDEFNSDGHGFLSLRQ